MLRKLFISIVFFTCCLFSQVFAQECNGGFGNPVAVVTFGSGNTGPALPASNTPYSFTSLDCPTDGQYAIRSRSINCYSQSWHSITDDHTPGSSEGLFMLVNGAVQPGDFYITTMNNLCQNINYEFSVWIMNVLKPGFCSGSSILPDITIRIESPGGAVITTYDAGKIPEIDRPSWRQYTTVFTVPPGVNSIVIRMTNNAKGGCGSEFAIDDIAVRPCGSLLKAQIAINNDVSINLCDGDNNSLPLNTSFSGSFNNPVYQWQQSTDFGNNWNDIAGANSTTYIRPPTPVGNYQYRMTISEGSNGNPAQCRIASNPVSVTVNALPNAQVTNYVFGCYGSTVILFAAGGKSYRWTGPNGFTSTVQQPSIPDVRFTDAGLYKVFVTDHHGCSNADSTNLEIYPAANATKGPDVSFCENDSSIITAGGGVRYKWIPSAGLSNDTIATPVAKPTVTMQYKAVVFSEYGCTDTATINVVVWKKPVVNAGPDKKMRPGYGVTLQGAVTGDDYTFSWSPPVYMNNSASLQPQVSPPADMVYELKAESTKGCGTGTDLVKVTVYDKLVIPNAFSPNGDGVNDTWIIEPLDLFEESEITVHDRYGRVAFRSKGYPKPWDGTRNGSPLPNGTYYYIIDLHVNNEPKLTGSILIVR